MERDVEMQLTAELASLQATVASGFANVDRRFDDQRPVLMRIEEQVRATNGRVTALEQDKHVRDAVTAARPLDAEPLTIERVKLLASYGGWLVAALFGLLKLAGKL